MQRNLNTSVLPEWAGSRRGGGAKGGSGENAVWNNNNKSKTFCAVLDATVVIN